MSGSARSVLAGPINRVYTTANRALKRQLHPKRPCLASPKNTTVFYQSGSFPHAEMPPMGRQHLQQEQGPHRALDTRVMEPSRSFYEGIRAPGFSQSSGNHNTPGGSRGPPATKPTSNQVPGQPFSDRINSCAMSQRYRLETAQSLIGKNPRQRALHNTDSQHNPRTPAVHWP